MKILAKHKWVSGAIITESDKTEHNGKYAYRRFTATIRGFRNWKIYEGETNKENLTELIINKVKEIRDKIDNKDETIFKYKGYFIK